MRKTKRTKDVPWVVPPKRSSGCYNEAREEAREYIFKPVYSSDCKGLTRRFSLSSSFFNRRHGFWKLLPIRDDKNRSHRSPRTIYFCGTFSRARFTFFSYYSRPGWFAKKLTAWIRHRCSTPRTCRLPGTRAFSKRQGCSVRERNGNHSGNAQFFYRDVPVHANNNCNYNGIRNAITDGRISMHGRDKFALSSPRDVVRAAKC